MSDRPGSSSEDKQRDHVILRVRRPDGTNEEHGTSRARAVLISHNHRTHQVPHRGQHRAWVIPPSQPH